MMNDRRIALFFLIIILLLTCTGCTQLNIDAGVDEKNNAYMIYTVEVDLSSMDANQAMAVINELVTTIERYENTLGFEILERETDFKNEKCKYKIAKTVPNSNYEEAFASLQDMLTDEEMTPFMQVDMTSKMTEYQQLYHFQGELDFGKIYNTTNIESFPPSMQSTIEKDFNSCKGEVTISLPGTNIEKVIGGKATVNGTHISITAPIEFSQKKELALSTRLTVDGDKPVSKPMERLLLELDIILRTWVAAGFIALMTIVGGVVLYLYKGKNIKEIPKSDKRE